MIFNDIKEIREAISSINDMIMGLSCSLDDVQETIKEYFSSEDEFGAINRINDKLNHIMADSNQVQKIMVAEKTMDKFSDYMKNIDKLNFLVNEFKGCVSTCRASIQERKDLSKQTEETKHKIDVIFENTAKIATFMQNCEKKSRKRGKTVKKKPRNNKKVSPIIPASESVPE